MTVENLYKDFFGNRDGFLAFLYPDSPKDFFAKGWKLERLQTYAAKRRDSALDSDTRKIFQDLIVVLEEERLNSYGQAEKHLHKS